MSICLNAQQGKPAIADAIVDLALGYGSPVVKLHSHAMTKSESDSSTNSTTASVKHGSRILLVNSIEVEVPGQSFATVCIIDEVRPSEALFVAGFAAGDDLSSDDLSIKAAMWLTSHCS